MGCVFGVEGFGCRPRGFWGLDIRRVEAKRRRGGLLLLHATEAAARQCCSGRMSWKGAVGPKHSPDLHQNHPKKPKNFKP